ncbi:MULTISPECIES: DNA recombination protein RmuC [unclassified Curtobacterium]|uniref:DNA recombination protein RmuC n=1 Tax=unclassified Curtobacterium TaxID=257496 RepID=UPI0008244846|nr:MULTISPECIES: DNA recombination protein RmuC [unclassified Curtobacterium]WIA97680.1 DNA recombination protein RmuC [Curtobacterium sp. MCBA15_004]
MQILALVIGLVLGIAVGAVVAFALARSRAGVDAAAAHATADALRAQLATVRSDSEERLDAQDAQYRRQVDSLERRAAELEHLVQRMHGADAARKQDESKVLSALSPVAQTLDVMRAKIAELEQSRSEQYGALSAQLRSAAESEERLRATADTLASALSSNSTRGVWGETQLRNVVEAAGLLERVDFDVQSSVTTTAGAARPDMVVHLPGGKTIAVDAKVPFSAYLQAAEIPATAGGAEGARRDQLVAQHVKALRAHVDALAAREYWSGYDASPELTIAFIPSESLVSSALAADPGLLDHAFRKRIALASPVTLWSVLKTVAFSWQQDVVTAEARELFRVSRELHGRLSTMAAHVDKLGRSIRGSVVDYNRFVGSLERQVLPSARRLSLLDESKVIADPAAVEDEPRLLTAPELVGALDED